MCFTLIYNMFSLAERIIYFTHKIKDTSKYSSALQLFCKVTNYAITNVLIVNYVTLIFKKIIRTLILQKEKHTKEDIIHIMYCVLIYILYI